MAPGDKSSTTRSRRPLTWKDWIPLLLLLASGVLCALGSYPLIQASRLVPLPYLTVSQLMQIPLCIALFAWGLTVVYGANTIPSRRMADFTRFGTGWEEGSARAIFTFIGVAMIAISLASLNQLLTMP